MKPLSTLEIEAILKVVVELLKSHAPASVYTSLQNYYELQGMKGVADFMRRISRTPAEIKSRLSEALSDGQVKSKTWLIEEIERVVPWTGKKVFVLGGWYGLLPLLLQWSYDDESMQLRSIDIDQDATRWAVFFNKYFILNRSNFFASTADMFDLSYKKTVFLPHHYTKTVREEPDIVINTSCEHLRNFDQWYKLIPYGRFVALQSNNFFECSEHVNCVESLESFRAQAPMTKIYYEGIASFEKYDRYMLIGEK